MARLTSSARKSLPKSDFALPGKRSASGGKGGYPIPDKSHARNALSRVSEYGTSAQKSAVRAKVHAKYPGIGKKGGGMSHSAFESQDHGGRYDHMMGRGKGKGC